MELMEFTEGIKGCRMMPHNYMVCHTGAVYFLFQFHMMDRLEDVGNFKWEDIMVI